MGSAPATPNRRPAGGASIAAPKAALSCAGTRACDGMLPALWGRRPPSASAHRKIRARDEPGRPRSPAGRSPPSPWRSRVLRRRQAAPGRRRASGDFPVKVSSAKFPTDQRLAETSDLTLEIENVGDEAGPGPRRDDLHRRPEGGRVVLRALRPARSRGPQPPGLDPRERLPEGRQAGRVQRRSSTPRPPGGAEAAQTDTFSFGPAGPRRQPRPRLARDARSSPAPTRSTTSSPPASTARRRRSPTTAARSRASSWSRSATSRRRPASTTRATSSPAKSSRGDSARLTSLRCGCGGRSAWGSRRCGSAPSRPAAAATRRPSTTSTATDHGSGAAAARGRRRHRG